VQKTTDGSTRVLPHLTGSEFSINTPTIVMSQQDEPNTQEPVDANDKAALTREALFKLVWSEPMLKVAARFGVSSSYMARVCNRPSTIA
jgi:hypothetical protein